LGSIENIKVTLPPAKPVAWICEPLKAVIQKIIGPPIGGHSSSKSWS
jgi:hypothetical protein